MVAAEPHEGGRIRMSKNDAIVLKANFEDWKQRRADGLPGDPWLYYCVDQFTKAYLLDDDEIQYGLTEGGNDGAVDAHYFIVNQRQLVADDTELDPKTVTRIRLLFIQVKHSGGFKPTHIERLVSTTDDFFDLSKTSDSFGTRYNSKLLTMMGVWKKQFIRVSGEFPELRIDYYYITGDDARPDDFAVDAGSRVTSRVSQHNRDAVCEFHFIGAQELWQQVQQRPPKARQLIWAEAPMAAKEGSVGLVRLKDYYEFIQDEPGVLAERILESNVRGWQRSTPVNEQISASLEADTHQTNFWLLNNGITIITPKTAQAGHLRISIQDPQVVNGLQTSREIFNHFSTASERDDDRSVLVRVIETDDATVQDRIIKATNSQNRMMPAQLRMTDQIHRDIEEVFKRVGFFYDRRKGFYRDQGKPIRKIISVNAAAQAAMSILLQRPNDARARPGTYFKSDERYRSLFGEGKFQLSAYLICVQLVRGVEGFLQEKRVERSDLKNLKFYVAAMVARELTDTARPPAAKLINIGNAEHIDQAIIQKAYCAVMEPYNTLAAKTDRDVVARGTELLKELDAYSHRRHVKKKAG